MTNNNIFLVVIMFYCLTILHGNFSINNLKLWSILLLVSYEYDAFDQYCRCTIVRKFMDTIMLYTLRHFSMSLIVISINYDNYCMTQLLDKILELVSKHLKSITI